MTELSEEEWQSRSSFYTVVGQSISLWASMETVLVNIFALLLGVNPPKAGLILFSIMNFNTWLQIISDLIADDPHFKNMTGAWNKKAERLRTMNDTRNRLAHHTIFEGKLGEIPTLRPSRLDTRSRTLSYKPLTVEEIDAFADKLTDLKKELQEFHISMLKHRAEQLLISVSDPPPTDPPPSDAQ